MLHALAIVTATVVGTMVGVEFAVAVFVNPILLRLPAGPSLEARADGARPRPGDAVLVSRVTVPHGRAGRRHLGRAWRPVPPSRPRHCSP